MTAPRSVDDEEHEAARDPLRVNDERMVDTHLLGELYGGALGSGVVGHRQRERHLHHAVAGGVAVRADDGHLSALLSGFRDGRRAPSSTSGALGG